jgi:hypothetical protein
VAAPASRPDHHQPGASGLTFNPLMHPAMNPPIITLEICPQRPGQPPLVRCTPGAEALRADTDAALVARAMLQAAAYLFAQGQPVAFGPEIPLEALK